MIRGRWFPQGSDLSVPLRLRQDVFARERDALDDSAQQVVVYQSDEPVGTARLWWQDGSFHLGDVGVLAAERGKGVGDLLVRLLLFKALSHYATVVELMAPPEVVGFFAKYGFVPADTDAQDAPEGLVLMVIRGDDIQLSHCGGCKGC